MKEKPPRPADALSEHEASVFAAELGDAVSVDLHGLSLDEARAELISFLHHAFMEGADVVKIITGRGTQKLKTMVSEVLSKESIVEYFRNTNNPAEMNAVTYAVLSKKI